jgi:tetratricopeptide (TPR) repeat protein
MLWLASSPADRGALFSAGARERVQSEALAGSEGLREHAAVLEHVVLHPEAVDLGALRDACRGVAGWAAEVGAPATRLAFLQSAALASPGDASLACEVGRIARDLGDHARGESWFRHAVRIARKDDWTSYVWSYVGLGVLYIRTGNLPAARAVMMRALRTARRHRLEELAGVAHHHLFHLTTEAGRLSDAYEHAWAALEAYGPDHARLPMLASDVGRFWLHVGAYERAYGVFTKTLLTLPKPNDQAMVSALRTWAAAGSGDSTRYATSRAETAELLLTVDGRELLEDTYTALAYADLAQCQWESARMAAAEAIRLATASGNNEARIRAEDLLTLAVGNQSPEGPHARAAPESPAVAQQGERLAGEFHRLLSAVK